MEQRDLLRQWLKLPAGSPWPPGHRDVLGLNQEQLSVSLINDRGLEKLTLLRQYQVLFPEAATEGMILVAKAVDELTEVVRQPPPLPTASTVPYEPIFPELDEIQILPDPDLDDWPPKRREPEPDARPYMVEGYLEGGTGELDFPEPPPELPRAPTPLSELEKATRELRRVRRGLKVLKDLRPFFDVPEEFDDRRRLRSICRRMPEFALLVERIDHLIPKEYRPALQTISFLGDGLDAKLCARTLVRHRQDIEPHFRAAHFALTFVESRCKEVRDVAQKKAIDSLRRRLYSVAILGLIGGAVFLGWKLRDWQNPVESLEANSPAVALADTPSLVVPEIPSKQSEITLVKRVQTPLEEEIPAARRPRQEVPAGEALPPLPPEPRPVPLLPPAPAVPVPKANAVPMPPLQPQRPKTEEEEFWDFLEEHVPEAKGIRNDLNPGRLLTPPLPMPMPKQP
jgi:hypothetical protein